MSIVYKVSGLGLTHEGQPIVEFEPDNPDGHHVVTLFRGRLTNVWHIDDVSPEVREQLRWEVERG